jgi:DNA-binding NtrC family response regulator
MTILVVEDNPNLLEAIADAVELYGYRVVKASSGAEAMTALENLDGDLELLISDFTLPGWYGHELYSHIHQLYPRCKGLIMSGYSPCPAIEAIETNPFLSFLPKPFGIMELGDHVTSLLGAGSES